MSAIVNMSFKVPDELLFGYFSHKLGITGAVLRYLDGPNKGRIVKHLEPVSVTMENTFESIGAMALKTVKSHPIATAVAVIGAGKLLQIECRKAKEWYYLKRMSESIDNYLSKIERGQLDYQTLCELKGALERAQPHIEKGDLKIGISVSTLKLLINTMCDYTVQLAEANRIDMKVPKFESSARNNAPITCLLSYVEQQKRVFELAA